ncbi:MAG TPA: glycosyltransferase family 39 protein [Methylomirabilota bacterium]|jgi:4-amino-4-deoxy-L-arabinose transferase-like glycosyltransferase|nr:glycosyltransferase family 39 protein [Methylomirabilota bacterium]
MSRALWRPAACIAGVLLLSALLAAIPAGRRPFWSSDEARFALLGQDALEHGRFLVAEIRGRDYLNKPQLFFWLVALASWPFGRVTELSAAIPGALASVGAVAGVIALGAWLWGWATGALAGLILATTPLHFEMAHQVLPDMMLTACLVWALYFFVTASTASWPAARLAGFYACLTGALLSKGPQALVAVAAVVVAVALTDGAATLRRLRLVTGLAAMLAVAAGVWLLPYHLHSAGRFGGQVIGGHYMTWYLLGPWLDRLESLGVPLGVFLPWTVLLVAAPLRWRQSPDAARTRIVLWVLTLWVLTALSGNFRSRYVLPILPGLALLTAELVTAPMEGRAGRALKWAAMAGVALTAGTAVVVWTPALLAVVARGIPAEDRTYLPTAAWEQTAMALCALIAAAALAVGMRRRDARIGAAGLGLGMAGMLVVAGLTYPARYERAFDVRPLAAAARASVPAEGIVIGHPDLRLSYDVYLGRRVMEMPNEPAVRAWLAAGAGAAFIMPAARWEPLAPGAGPTWRVLASRTLRGRPIVVIGRGTS